MSVDLGFRGHDCPCRAQLVFIFNGYNRVFQSLERLGMLVTRFHLSFPPPLRCWLYMCKRRLKRVVHFKVLVAIE